MSQITNDVQPGSAPSNQSVFEWVMIAKGFAIILVVIGHYLPTYSPEYWRGINKTIYAFHMPLFFVLSGYLYSHGKYTYSSLIRKKIKRLLYPFFSIALIFFFLKYVAALFFVLDHPVEAKSLFLILVNPVQSYMPLLWFVHTLFLIFLIYPPLKKILRNDLLVFILTLLINVLLWTNTPALISNPFLHIPYFIIGSVFREKEEVMARIITGGWPAIIFFLTLFGLMLLGSYSFEMEGKRLYLYRLITSCSGAFLTMNIAVFLSYSRSLGMVKNFLATIGYYSMTIYLFHTLFVSAVRIFFQQMMDHVTINFEISAMTAVVAGLLFPLYFEKIVLRNNRFTRKYILGLS